MSPIGAWPAANWYEAAEKARYLLNLFAATLAAQDPRRQTLIAAVPADFARLSGERAIAVFDDAAPGGPIEVLEVHGEPIEKILSSR